MTEYDTLPKLLLYRAQETGDKVAMRYKNLGIWEEYTWNDYLREVRYFALGLERIGFARGDRLAIIGENDPEWYWAELSGQALGGITVGIFSDTVSSEVNYLVSHSESKFVVASDQEQVDKLLEIKDEVPHVKKIIYWDYKGMNDYDDELLISWEEVRNLGKEYEAEDAKAFMDRVFSGKADDTALFLYTSGTSGKQKGAMRSHQNMITSALIWSKDLEITEIDRHFSFYSPAWITEQLEGIAVSLVSGQMCHFPENSDTASRDMREVGPTIFFTASRIWEGLASTIQVRINDASRLKRFFYNVFMPVGQKMAGHIKKREKPGLGFRLLYEIADLLVFARLRDRMGLLKVREGLTAGALLSPEAFGYFWALGIPIRQVYGLTEFAPITMHQKDDIDEDTIGRPIKGVEVKISEEGEILAKGEGLFKGYYNNLEETEEAIRDGWFHTGDWGMINEKGHVIVYDRLKSAVKLKTGQKFAPQYIESRLKFSPYINDAIIFGGENYDYVTVIINIEFANVTKWADKNKVNYSTFTDLSQRDQVYDLIHEEIKRVNKNIKKESRITRFTNLYKQLDADEEELTRTRKVKRNVFEEKYKALIDGLYSDESEIQVETMVRYRDGKTSVINMPVQFKNV